MSDTVRWGILSTAKIGTEKVIPATQRAARNEVVAIASRDAATAAAAAERLGVPRSHASYEDLLADPDVDAIYNPLPNHLHVPWSIRALEAGKHVLCEKPIGCTSDDGRELVAAGQAHPDLVLAEAFMYRHHPQWREARAIVDEGGIGELRTIQSFFSYFNRDAANIRNKKEWGGGGLLDIGCYPVSLSRFIYGAEPDRVIGIVEDDPEYGVDRLASAILDFGRGTSTFTCSTQVAPHQRVNLVGTEGRVELEIPFNAPHETPCRVWHHTDAGVRELDLAACDQYTAQAESFAASVLDGVPYPTPITDAVDNMVVLERIFESGRTGSWA